MSIISTAKRQTEGEWEQHLICEPFPQGYTEKVRLARSKPGELLNDDGFSPLFPSKKGEVYQVITEDPNVFILFVDVRQDWEPQKPEYCNVNPGKNYFQVFTRGEDVTVTVKRMLHDAE